MKKAIIIGGGIAGMQTALRLKELGIEALVLEKEAEPGGKLRGWHALFPTFTPAGEVLSESTSPCLHRKFRSLISIPIDNK